MARLTINGKVHDLKVAPDTPLLWAIREWVGLTGTKYGCGVAQCGACTVHINGEATRSCQVPVGSVEGKKITTIEGLAQGGKLHPVQQAWIDEQVPACGYCQNGQMLTAKALLDKNPNPTDAQIRDGMKGVLCRCMTYYGINAAVKRAAKVMA